MRRLGQALGLAALAVSLLAADSASPADRFDRWDDEKRAAHVRRSHELESFDARLELLTRPLLGTPYGLSPLGEGEGIDADPRLRWDLFDCLTFVETAIALAASPRPEALERVLDDVRYAALPATFVNRNHFVEAQWLPNNLLKGYVRDVTSQVGGDRVRQATKQFSPARWAARKQLGDMPLQSDEVPRGEFSLPLVPLEVARERVRQIPSGTLLFVVRKDFYTQPTRVTHVGLVLGEGDRKVLRHASGKPFLRVVDEPLVSFLARNARYKGWPVEGVSLYAIEHPASRIAQLLEEALPDSESAAVTGN